MNRLAFQCLAVALLLSACSSFYNDYRSDFIPTVISKLETGTYGDVAWINEHTIAVITDQETLFINNKMCIREDLLIMDIKSNDLQKIKLYLEDDCEVYSLSNLQKLPNGNIGYLFGFQPYEQNQYVKQLELMNGKYILSQELKISLDQFSFSPDTKTIAAVQVEDIDASKIILISEEGKETNIAPDFVRAELPTWSKTNLIAFFGNKSFEEEKEPNIQFYSFEKYLYYPWQLYLCDPDTNQITELPLEVVAPGDLKWSPDSQSLAFRGEINNVRGVWLVSNLNDSNNLIITRLINAEATFDFSPDGKSMVFAYIGLQNIDKQNMLFMIDLPE